MTIVEFRGVSKSYGRLPVLRDLDLAVEAGAMTVIYGLPACGKSVLVRLLAGLEKPDGGRISLRGKDAGHSDPGERNIGYVPQMFALYPHYSVYENVAYPLQLAGVPRKQIDATVRRVAGQLKIDHLLDQNPNKLSGGEKQRVALARGVVKHTDIFVLDDPLASLDFKLREQLFDDLRELQESLGATFIYTTSDPLEALSLADYVAVLDRGRIGECGMIQDVYRQPRYLHTMEFLGFPPSNRLAGDIVNRDGQVWCRTGLFECPVALDPPGHGLPPGERREVAAVVRPHDIALDVDASDGFLICQANVILRDDLGGEMIVHLDVNGSTLVTVVSHAKDGTVSKDRLAVGIRPSAVTLFSPDTGCRIGKGR